jgi:hypothetical protein
MLVVTEAATARLTRTLKRKGLPEGSAIRFVRMERDSRSSVTKRALVTRSYCRGAGLCFFWMLEHQSCSAKTRLVSRRSSRH